MNSYQAGKYVRQGVADEHAYNLFLSFTSKCTRLKLWEKHMPWIEVLAAFDRLTVGMKKR